MPKLAEFPTIFSEIPQCNASLVCKLCRIPSIFIHKMWNKSTVWILNMNQTRINQMFAVHLSTMHYHGEFPLTGELFKWVWRCPLKGNYEAFYNETNLIYDGPLMCSFWQLPRVEEVHAGTTMSRQRDVK